MRNQQAMKELKELLIKNFPGYIDKVILFGSQAKGSAQDYSDYDILVILKKPYDWRMKNQIYDKTWEIDFKYNILTDMNLAACGGTFLTGLTGLTRFSYILSIQNILSILSRKRKFLYYQVNFKD